MIEGLEIGEEQAARIFEEIDRALYDYPFWRQTYQGFPKDAQANIKAHVVARLSGLPNETDVNQPDFIQEFLDRKAKAVTDPVTPPRDTLEDE